ncbi:SOS response-associated peptidase [Bacillus testis]|uniref:SOS response-associated peptidase n=1 Tax=Bacillus testis TaxID=1622072 RepID=UPI00067F376B|nr:SOS response-associated peptidase [Bacillus testis]
MCGRFTLFADYETIINRFQIEAAFDEADYRFSYNIAPSQSVVSVINDGTKNRLGFLRWGLIPAWAKDEKIGYKMINARAETLAEKPSFRNSFKHKRCLIVADSFYEWKRSEKRKTPMRIKMKTDEPFGMAGLWETWRNPEGKPIYTCSIVTTTANQFMSAIHDRMPVILRLEDEQQWLNPNNHNTDELSKLLKPFDDHLLEAFEVSSEVNSPKNNSPNLIKQIC